ncbi:hypothetical protein GE09DRAFT_1099675 [Coniochaeta sp. 2T2.1]|nr:hypothetical protein GE09DRAFT_1099675 [Coniochaeta sp. 2T2.1]
MDPLSITSGALACITAIVQTSKAITNFIRGCREARSDLTVISRELSELGIVLELLKDDSDVADDRVIPEAIQRQILSILANCKDVIGKIDDLLAQYDGKTGPARWVLSGKRDAANLRQSLEAHRGALGLALETVTLSIAKDIKQDTTALRNDTTDIKEDTGQILAEIERLKQLVSANGDESSKFLLNRYLDNMTTYAETVCDETTKVYDSPHYSGDENSRLGSPARDEDFHSRYHDTITQAASEGPILDPDGNRDPQLHRERLDHNFARIFQEFARPASRSPGLSPLGNRDPPAVGELTTRDDSSPTIQQAEGSETQQKLRSRPQFDSAVSDETESQAATLHSVGSTRRSQPKRSTTATKSERGGCLEIGGAEIDLMEQGYVTPTSTRRKQKGPDKHPFERAARQRRRRPSSEPGTCSDTDHSDCGFEVDGRGNLAYVHHERARPVAASMSFTLAGDSAATAPKPSPSSVMASLSEPQPLVLSQSVPLSFRGRVSPMEFSPDSLYLAFHVEDRRGSRNEVQVTRVHSLASFSAGPKSAKMNFTSWFGSHEAKSVSKLSFYGPGSKLLTMETNRKRITQKPLIEMWDWASDKRVKLPGTSREVIGRDSVAIRDWTTSIAGFGGYMLWDTDITSYPFVEDGSETLWPHPLPLRLYPRVKLVSMPTGTFIAAYGARDVNPESPLLAFLDSKGYLTSYLMKEGDETAEADDLLSAGQLPHDSRIKIACVWGQKHTARRITVWYPETESIHTRTAEPLIHPKIRHNNVLYGIREGADSKLFLVRQLLSTLGSRLHNLPIDVRHLPKLASRIVPSRALNFEVSPDGKTLAIPSPLGNAVLLYDLPPIPGVSEADITPLEAVEPYTILGVKRRTAQTNPGADGRPPYI